MIDINTICLELCSWSISYYMGMADWTHTSYGFVNTLTFIILMPVAILCFICTSLMFAGNRNKTKRILGTTTFIIGILSIIALAFLHIGTFLAFPELWNTLPI